MMCRGFGIIYTKTGRALFIPPMKVGGNMIHSDILNRAEIKENSNAFIRSFVRIEYSDWKVSSFQIDEAGTLPGWAEEEYLIIKERCNAVLESILQGLKIFEDTETLLNKEEILLLGRVSKKYYKKSKAPYIDMLSPEWEVYSEKCLEVSDIISEKRQRNLEEYINLVCKNPGCLI